MNKKVNIRVPNFKIILRKRDREFILGKISRVLTSNRWTAGGVTRELENSFKKYAGSFYAVAVNSGGAGLAAALQALNISENSLIVCPTLTAPPTVQAILAAGMQVVLVDSCSDDLGLNLKDVERKLSTYKNKIKAVICVHVGGWISPQIYTLNKLCRKFGAYLIEDCAHASGSSLGNKPAGSVGAAAVFSLFMTKPLTSGEGGLVITNNKKIAEAVRVIRNYGKDQSGRHIRSGFNYKLSEFNAAVALWAVKNADYIVKQRQQMARRYDGLLKHLRGAAIFKVPGVSCSYYKYILLLDKGISREKFKSSLLRDYGVELAGGVYDTLCHQEPVFKSSKKILNAGERFDMAEEFSSRQVCLPLYLGLKEGEQKYAANSAISVLEKLRN